MGSNLIPVTDESLREIERQSWRNALLYCDTVAPPYGGKWVGAYRDGFAYGFYGLKEASNPFDPASEGHEVWIKAYKRGREERDRRAEESAPLYALLDQEPPPALLGDELASVMGAREMEIALQLIITKAVAAKSWRVPLRTKDFQERDILREGFEELIRSRWIVATAESWPKDEWHINPSLVQKLRDSRPGAFAV